MRGLIINNGGHAPVLLEKYFTGGEVYSYSQMGELKTEGYDYAVLSGSSTSSVVGNEDKLKDELDFIRTSAIPILGICYGFELIVTAFGGTLKRMGHKEQGVGKMTVTKNDPMFQGVEDLFVYEGHRWVAETLPVELETLARSPHGVEAVKHRERLLYGVQFHPEKLQRETAGGKILENFLHIVGAQQH